MPPSTIALKVSTIAIGEIPGFLGFGGRGGGATNSGLARWRARGFQAAARGCRLGSRRNLCWKIRAYGMPPWRGAWMENREGGGLFKKN